MSGLQQIRERIKSFQEIRDILESLKTMAQIEIQKLARFQDSQSQATEAVRAPLRDLLSFHPYLWTKEVDESQGVLLVFGSERGFCGDFNASLEMVAEGWKGPLVLIGSRLTERFAERENVHHLTGPVAVEEVEGCLYGLLEVLNGLGPVHLTALLHDEADRTRPQPQPIWPVQEEPPEPEYGYPPEHHLPLERLLSRLLDHYFSAILHRLLYSSLLAENRHRIRHLEGAVQHLDQNVESLKRRRNKRRQEEITNEIEVLLMGAEFLD